jgi:hypothetical protein
MTEPSLREYQLIDAINLLRRSWKWLVVFGLLGLIAAGAYLALAPTTYEGRAQIELAKHGVLRNPYDLTYVSEPRIAVNRIRSVDFFDDATLVSCGIPKGNETAKSIAKTIKPSVAKGTSYVEVAVTSTNKEIIKGCLEAVFKRLEKEQLEALEKIDSKIVAKLKEFESGVAKKNAIVQDLKTRSGSIVIYIDSGAADVLLDERIGGLRAYVENRKLREPAFLNYEPPTEKKLPGSPLVLAIALILGLVVGMMVYLASQALKRLRARDTASSSR